MTLLYFDVIHQDNDSLGDAKYRYVFKSDSLSDSAFVDFIFRVPGECIATSISDNLNFDLNLIYNNSTGEIVFSSLLNQECKIEIVDLQGKLYFSSKIENSSIIIPKRNFNSGIYFVRISDSRNTITSQKILISN